MLLHSQSQGNLTKTIRSLDHLEPRCSNRSKSGSQAIQTGGAKARSPGRPCMQCRMTERCWHPAGTTPGSQLPIHFSNTPRIPFPFHRVLFFPYTGSDNTTAPLADARLPAELQDLQPSSAIRPQLALQEKQCSSCYLKHQYLVRSHLLSIAFSNFRGNKTMSEDFHLRSSEGFYNKTPIHKGKTLICFLHEAEHHLAG